MSDFDVKTRPLSPREAQILVAGGVDLETGRKLELEIDAAFKAGVDRVFVDLTDCSFIDSFGMAALIRPADRREPLSDSPSDTKADSLVVVGARGDARHAIEWARLEALVPLYDSLEEARRSQSG